MAFYNQFTINDDVADYQVVVKKSRFASAQSAKELKINTVNYAAEILENAKLTPNAKKRILQKISGDSAILTIGDLKKCSYFPKEIPEVNRYATFIAIHEGEIVEKDNYIQLVKEILAKGDKVNSRDILELALGLKDYAEKGSFKYRTLDRTLFRIIL